MCMYFAIFKLSFLCFLDRPNKTAQVAGSVPKDYQKSEPPGKLHVFSWNYVSVPGVYIINA